MQDSQIPNVLAHWLALQDVRRVERVQHGHALSGAQLWHVQTTQGDFCLRRWQVAMPGDQLQCIHELQWHLQRSGLGITPVPQPLRETGRESRGRSILSHAGHLWELATWLRGTDVLGSERTDGHLVAAFRALAEVHVAASSCAGPTGDLPPPAPSPGLRSRWQRLSAIERGESLVDGGVIDRLPHDPVGELAREARRLAQTLAPVARRQIESWRDRTVPQQWCLGDVRAEHFLFVGHRVTGVLDFGAAHVESIAGDLARLLTETIGAAAPLRDLVLSEYTAVRPTTSVEIQSIEVFAAATLPVALARWLEWLFDVPDGNPLPDWDSREVVRLRRLVALC